MKKVVLILLAMILCFFTTSLAVDNLYDMSPSHYTIMHISNYKDLSQLPFTYLPEEAIKNGDVVSLHHSNYNVNTLDNFIENYERNSLASNEMVRITQYSVEGAPIIEDLIFTNNTLILKKDSSRDMYISPKDSKVIEYEIKRLYTKIIKDSIFYMVETTSGDKLPIAVFLIN